MGTLHNVPRATPQTRGGAVTPPRRRIETPILDGRAVSMPPGRVRADLAGFTPAELNAERKHARQELDALEIEIARVRNVLVVLVSDRHEATVYLRKIITRLEGGESPSTGLAEWRS